MDHAGGLAPQPSHDSRPPSAERRSNNIAYWYLMAGILNAMFAVGLYHAGKWFFLTYLLGGLAFLVMHAYAIRRMRRAHPGNPLFAVERGDYAFNASLWWTVSGAISCILFYGYTLATHL